MDRQLAVWCPELLVEEEDGRRSRAFAQVLELTRAYSPAAAPVRPGVCALPTRGPARYFGGEGRLARRLQDDLDGAGQVGVADGLFAALLAARTAVGGPVVVPPGGTPAFLAPWPVEALDRPELADLLRRLGLPTLGAFAARPTRHVLGRLGVEAARCQAVARGVEGELPGARLAPRVRPTAAEGGRPAEGRARQAGFWGEAAAAEDRADRAVRQVEPLVGPEGTVVGRLQGGRGPSERARLVPWTGRHLEPARPGCEPWPGQLPPPAPAVVPARPLAAALVDGGGGEVGCSATGLATAAPARLSVAGGPWQEVATWAGPWPADERWWAAGHRRRARMQLVTTSGAAYLVVREGTAWWVEGAYD